MLSRSVMITGCNRGLGLEMVRQLVDSEHPPEVIIATCRNPNNAKDLQALATEHARLKIIKFDVVDYKDLPRVAKEVSAAVGSKGLSLLVNNAGIVEKSPTQLFGIPLPDLTPETVNDVLNTNVTAPLMLVKELLPLIRQAAGSTSGPLGVNRAAVINISSTLGSMGDWLAIPNTYGYRASKAALNMLTKTLSQDYGDDGVLFVSVHPGWVQTDMGSSAGELTPQESITAVIKLMAGLNETNSGLMMSYDGCVLKW